MRILIRDKKMPENCQECFCLNDEYFYCQAMSRKPSDENVIQRRPDWCPLVEIPPHGRLIDADALTNRVGSYMPIKWTYEYGSVVSLNDIEHAPTVIPAEESEV